MKRARAGDIDTAARCELAVAAYHGGHPTPEQRAGAALRALYRADVHALVMAFAEEA